MKRSKKTKKALTGSVLALVLCFVMLLGTTFAWFTDTASTGVNSVVSGTLKIDIVDKEGKSVQGKTLNFVNIDGSAIEKDILWEPGCTYVLPAVRVVNKGNLALEYKVEFKASGDEELAEVLELHTVSGETTTPLKDKNGTVLTLADALDCEDADGFAHGHLPGGEKSAEVAYALHMKESAGNEYKGMTIDGVTITVLAKQDTVEYDSTTNQYDANAEYDTLGWDGTVASEEQLLATVTDYVYSTNEETGAETIGRQFNISSPELLAAYAVYVNAGNCRTTDKVVLTEDINLGNQNWTPIGTSDHPFTARTFDGQNHTISNLKCNGGAENPTNKLATNQGLFGVTYTNGNIVEIMNLNIHNVDIYAMNSAGAVIGCLDTAQSSYWLAGYTGIHDIKLTGKVTIEGGNSGGIAGSPTAHWALQTGFSRITIDVDEGSYLSNVKARELSGTNVGGALGGVVAIAAWDRGSTNITSNLDVIGVAGNVGGIVGVGNQVWYQINYTGDVTVKGVTPSEDGKYNYGLAIGGFAPVWHHYDMSTENRATVLVTGTLTLELTNGTTVNTNGQASDAIGGFFW